MVVIVVEGQGIKVQKEEKGGEIAASSRTIIGVTWRRRQPDDGQWMLDISLIELEPIGVENRYELVD